MKKKTFYICLCLVLICLLIAGCTTYKSQTNRIQVGMTKQQVINIMGQPRDRKIEENTERWYYWKNSYGGFSSSSVWIYFTDGRVSSMTTDN
jgi:outer membrane protein assembly factor BamE (lipoprotein component of BamABCDE complex)